MAMTLIEYLVESGVLLNQDIGFMVEVCDGTDVWVPTHAIIGRVGKIPVNKQRQGHNPDCDILVEWKSGAESHLSTLSLRDDAELYEMDEAGLIFLALDERIIIGQSDTFMEDIYKARMPNLVEER
jgi:hypothetical protein